MLRRNFTVYFLIMRVEFTDRCPLFSEVAIEMYGSFVCYGIFVKLALMCL